MITVTMTSSSNDDQEFFDEKSPWTIPSDFAEWISKPVFGNRGTEYTGNLFRIYKTTEGDYVLYRKWREIKIRPYNPIEYKVVKVGDLITVIAIHGMYTEKPPIFIRKHKVVEISHHEDLQQAE